MLGPPFLDIVYRIEGSSYGKRMDGWSDRVTFKYLYDPPRPRFPPYP